MKRINIIAKKNDLDLGLQNSSWPIRAKLMAFMVE